MTVTGLPVPEVERYLSRAELAERLGVSVATIDRMVAEGCPSETWGRRIRRFQATTVLVWLRSDRDKRRLAGPTKAPRRRVNVPGPTTGGRS